MPGQEQPPGEPGEECGGLARLCPAEQEAGMWQGELGQVIKELKCCLPPEPSCPFPAAGTPGAELSGLVLPGLPGTDSGEDDAESSSLFSASPGRQDRGTCQVRQVRRPWGGPGPHPRSSVGLPRVFVHHFISEQSLNAFLCEG